MSAIVYRRIESADDPFLFDIISKCMNEFGADPAGTVLGDDSIKKMSENYNSPGAVYYTALVEGIIAGGSGIKQLDGTSEKICELQRMFLLPEYRGRGIGRHLLSMCLHDAKEFGYTGCYLESLSGMKDAFELYKKSGFEIIKDPMGNTGHGSCNVYMFRKLT